MSNLLLRPSMDEHQTSGARRRSSPRDLVRVAIADRTRMSGQMLANVLRRDRTFEVADVTAEPSQVLTDTPCDIVIISAAIENQEVEPFALLQELQSQRPSTQAILLLDEPRKDLVLRAFRHGARGVFSRCDSLDLLPTCIRKVHEKQIWANSRVIEFLVQALIQAPITNVVNAEGEALLSKREQQVVKFVAEGLGNREIGQELNLSEHIERGVVKQIVDDVKTELSSQRMVCADGVLKVLADWKQAAQFSSVEDWMFASIVKIGRQPLSYTYVWKTLDAAAKTAGIGHISSHTFRHTYRTWLDSEGTPVAVQRKCMRHADIRTTMNQYGDALSEDMRQALQKVASRAIPETYTA